MTNRHTTTPAGGPVAVRAERRQTVKGESTNWLCRDYSTQAERIKRASKELAEATIAANQLKGEIEHRMRRAEVNCMVGPDGTAFVVVDTGDFAPDFDVVKSCTPWDVDRILAPEPPGDPDEDGNPVADPAVVAAVKGWAMAEGGAA